MWTEEIKDFFERNKIKIDTENPPIHIAAQSGNLKAIEYLLDQGADIHAKNNRGSSPLFFAASNGYLEVVKYLVDKKADIHAKNNYGNSPLFIAAQNGHLGLARYLVYKGADIHEKNKNGSSPIHFAAAKGYLGVVEYLVDKGADIHAKSNDGFSPLLFAAQEGRLEVARYLVDKGADVNAKNKHGSSPLLFAAVKGHLEVARYLVDKGADIHAKNKHGSSPLLIAAQEGHLEVARYLVDKGADVNAKSNFGYSLTYFATLAGDLEVGKFLLNQILREKSDLKSKIAEIKRANSSPVEKEKEQDWQRCVKEAFFENVIPIKLLQKVNQNFFPEFLFKKKTLFSQASPCDTFNVVSELSGGEKGAFTGSSLPSQKLLKKTIILDRNSFAKNATKLTDEDRWRAVEFLIGNNFEVYLAVKKEGGADFIPLTLENSLNPKALNDSLNNKNIADFKPTEDLFKKLTKLNPQISADGLINPSVEDMFFVAALSHFSSSKDLSPTDELFKGKIGLEDISSINSTLRAVDNFNFSRRYNKPKYYLIFSAPILIAAIVFLLASVRSLYQANRTGQNKFGEKVSNNSYNPEFAHQIISSMPDYSSLGNASYNLNATNLIGEMIYDNLVVGEPAQEIQSNKTTQGFLNSLSQSLYNSLANNDNWQVRSRPKKGIAYISSQVGNYEIKEENSSSSSFQMESIGEALNPDGSPINIRTDLENFEINKEGKLFFKPRVETIFKQFVPEVLTESKVNKFKDSYDASYFRFSTDLAANQRTRLFSVSSSEKLVGIIEDSHDLKIEKGEDGFFYATSSSHRKLSYVIRAEEGLLKDNVEELLPTNHPIQKIIDDYSDAKKGFYLSTPKDFALPKNKENDIDKWLNEIYETRSGACRYRVAAVYNKIVKNHPSQKENVRIVGINNNHVVLEVRQDEKSNWLPINLGGSEAELSYKNNYDQKIADDLPFIEIGSVAFVGTILALALKSYKKGLSTKKEDLKKAGKNQDDEDRH